VKAIVTSFLFHAFANLHQQLIICLESDQTCPWVLDVKDNVHHNYCDETETQNVDPTPVLADRHAIARQ
jgi:hypothetical protein